MVMADGTEGRDSAVLAILVLELERDIEPMVSSEFDRVRDANGHCLELFCRLVDSLSARPILSESFTSSSSSSMKSIESIRLSPGRLTLSFLGALRSSGAP